MYPASADFHNAVKNGNPQMPLLIFPNAVFTAEDIDVNAGIEFDDLFNTEENTSIGQALMNNIRFTLFNDNQLLNDYEFGEFIATIGVQIDESTYTQEGNISVTCGNNTYVATSSSPYLTRNGTAMDDAPTGKRENGHIFTYKESTGERISLTNDKSIFDSSITEWVTGYYISSSGTYVEGSNYRYSGYYFPVKASTRYVARYTKTQNAGHHVIQYDANKNFITRNVLSTASDTREEHKVHLCVQYGKISNIYY